jgi:hypothetical protein
MKASPAPSTLKTSTGKPACTSASSSAAGSRPRSDAAASPSFTTRSAACARARAQRSSRVLGAARDAELLLRADDEVAVAEQARDRVGAPREAVALRALAVAREPPEHRPVVDVEDHAAPRGLAAATARFARGARASRQVRPGDEERAAARDELRSMSRRRAHVGAVVAVEDVREVVAVADGEEDQRREARGSVPTCETSTPSRASVSRTKRPFCSSPTRVIIATRGPRRAAPTAVLAGEPPR